MATTGVISAPLPLTEKIEFLILNSAASEELPEILSERLSVSAPEYLHYFMGGMHCFVNILE